MRVLEGGTRWEPLEFVFPFVFPLFPLALDLLAGGGLALFLGEEAPPFLPLEPLGFDFFCLDDEDGGMM
jgi:hypothetical protein